MIEALLSVANLAIERGGRTVIADLSFTLRAGDALLVSGRNGAGKSTLLRAIAGLLPLAAGAIHFGLASEEVRGIETVHFLGYADALKPTLSLRENLDFWAAMLRAAPDKPRAGLPGRDPRAALDALGLARLLDMPAAYLSAGQKRRVALARLLLAPRPLWLLDEPLIALDATAQAQLTELMGAHVSAGGAILVASHQPLALAHRELALDGGAVARPATGLP
jgi:heme exporter protein A